MYYLFIQFNDMHGPRKLYLLNSQSYSDLIMCNAVDQFLQNFYGEGSGWGGVTVKDA